MKSILLLLSISFFTSYGQNNNQLAAKNTIEKEVLKQIKNHYQVEYGKGAKLEEKNSDSILNLIYRHIPKDKDDYDGFIIDIYIPKKIKMNLFGANPILYGDLNNDKTNELLISVHTEGDGSGSNNVSQDIFVFQMVKGNYQISNITPDAKISGCADGYFRATKILNGFLIGQTSCFKEDDARCCPSLEYVTKVKLINKTLKFFNKLEKNTIVTNASAKKYLEKSTSYYFSSTTDSLYCNKDSTGGGDCIGGEIYLTKKGNAIYIYECCCSGEDNYHIGKYSIVSNGIKCVFTKECTYKGVLKNEEKWELLLNNINCDSFIYSFEETGQDEQGKAFIEKYVVQEVDKERTKAFVEAALGFKKLVPFLK